MKNKIIIPSVIVLGLIAAFYSFNSVEENATSANTSITPSEEPNVEGLGDDKVNMPDLKDWPEASRKAAKEIESKYGKPNAATADMIIWKNNGMWLKTVVYKKEMKHNFPHPHSDVVEQWINHRVPTDNYDELAMYDGSVTANRTNGTISARCDNEAMNILALNLTHDIVVNKKIVEQARNDHGVAAMAFMKGEKPTYTQKLNFTSDPTAPDLDTPMDMMQEKTGMGGK